MIIDRCSQDNMGVVPLVVADFKEKKEKKKKTSPSASVICYSSAQQSSLSSSLSPLWQFNGASVALTLLRVFTAWGPLEPDWHGCSNYGTLFCSPLISSVGFPLCEESKAQGSDTRGEKAQATVRTKLQTLFQDDRYHSRTTECWANWKEPAAFDGLHECFGPLRGIAHIHKIL